MDNRYGIRAYLDPELPVEVKVRDEWVSDQTYKEVVQKTVISCTDAIVTVIGDYGAVYLTKRSVYPMKGLWCLGGRIFFNDKTLEESVARCIALETSLQFSQNRFRFICTHLYSWNKTNQGDFPGRNLAPLYVLEVSKEELVLMSGGLKQTEYDIEFGFQRFSRERLIDERVHPAMLDAFDDIFPNLGSN